MPLLTEFGHLALFDPEYRPFALADVGRHRLTSRERLAVPHFPHWAQAEQHKPTFSGWLGSWCFTPASPRAPRVCQSGRTVTLPSTGEVLPDIDILELRGPYLDEVYNGGRSRPAWGHEHDVIPFERFGGLSMPNFFRPGTPTEPIVLLDAYSDYWQLMQLIGTRVEFEPATGKWYGAGRWPSAEDLRRTKLYISVISHAMTTWKGRRWVKGEPVETRNPFYQPQYAHLMARLHHARAEEMVDIWEAWGVATDGFWVPERLEAEAQAWLLERWGTATRAKERWKPGQRWRAAMTNNVRSQPEAVREALSASLRRDLPPSPGSYYASQAERVEEPEPDYPHSTGPALDWAPEPSDVPVPRPPRRPVPKEERAAREKARYRRMYEAGELVPPPMPAWMEAARTNALRRGRPDPFWTPPDEPWLSEGWSLVLCAPLEDFSEGLERPDWAEDDEGGESDGWVPEPRGPPLDWCPDEDF